ncbi:MAG: radical SAM protein [Candidatus Omnitrophota bacterium]
MKCNRSCVYCTSGKDWRDVTKSKMQKKKLEISRIARLPGYNLQKFSFSGGGEPLLYMDRISDWMKFLRQLNKNLPRKPWYYLYTNGILADKKMLLRLRDLGFDEVRFHLGSSNFSKKVYKNVENAVAYFKAVTIETPAWPPHRKKLFEMLPIIEAMGVKHVNIGEIEINRHNFLRILEALPDAEIYAAHEVHMDDGGLVYDIFEEVIRKKYSYSVIDCSCFVKAIQRGKAGWITYRDLDGLFAEY